MENINFLLERHEIAKNEVAQLVTNFDLNNLNIDNEHELMYEAWKLIDNWCSVVKKIFTNESFNEEESYNLLALTTFNDKDYNKYVMKVFNNDYHQIIIEVKILLYYLYSNNHDNVVAKAFSYAFEKGNPKIHNLQRYIDDFYNDLMKIYNGDYYGKRR